MRRSLLHRALPDLSFGLVVAVSGCPDPSSATGAQRDDAEVGAGDAQSPAGSNDADGGVARALLDSSLDVADGAPSSGDANGSEDAGASADAGAAPDAVAAAEDASQPEAGACGSGSLIASQPAPDFLFLLDRSASMLQGAPTRWSAATSGLKNATLARDADLRFGVMLFPATSPPPSTSCDALPEPARTLCAMNIQADTCRPGLIDLSVREHAAAAIAAGLDRSVPMGATPTAASLNAAREALVGTGSAPSRPTAVVLLTDGAPNCSGGDPVAETETAIAALKARGTPTYVLGFSADDPTLGPILDRFARAGGTNGAKHRVITDAGSVQTQLSSVFAAQGPDCAVRLTGPAQSDALVVKLEGAPVNLDFVDGFTLSSGDTLQLHGEACSFYTSGHTLTVTLACP